MTNSILRRNHGNRGWLIELETGPRLHLHLQPTGSVLVEGRISKEDPTWYSCYVHHLENCPILNNLMYGKQDQYRLFPSEQLFLLETAEEMREAYRDFWDAKYAPGPDFTGG